MLVRNYKDEALNMDDNHEGRHGGCAPMCAVIRATLMPIMMLCVFHNIPHAGSLPMPITNTYSKDSSSGTGLLESKAHDFLQQTKSDDIFASNIFPRRNLWELISSSSDVIPLRRTFNNGSLHFPHWSSGTGVSGSFASSSTSQLSVESRLQKLDHHFNTLKVFDDDCRQRLLCEIAESPTKFSPLTSSFLDETSFNGDEKLLASKLLETNDGTRLLTYIEASQRGASRQGCEIWTYRCPRGASALIDFKSLLVWREISKWLTVKFVAKKHQ